MNWIFKTENIISDKRIEFSQKRNFKGQKNEKIVSLKRVNGEWFFDKYYNISNVEVKGFEDKKLIILELELIEDFGLEKPLNNFIYSLARITKFRSPINHFRRHYNRIGDLELRAIVKDEIYFERTYLGIILNSLHIEHKKSFINYLAQTAPENLTNKFDVEKTFKYLLEYLETHVLFPAEILVAANEDLEDLVSQDYHTKISFTNDDELNSNLINSQSRMIEENLPLFREIISDFNEVNYKSKSGFKNLFENSKIPMTI